jgi:hypothetical protein
MIISLLHGTDTGWRDEPHQMLRNNKTLNRTTQRRRSPIDRHRPFKFSMKQGRRSISLVRFPDPRGKKTLALCEGTHQVTHLQVNVDLRQDMCKPAGNAFGRGREEWKIRLIMMKEEVERTQSNITLAFRGKRERIERYARTVRNHEGHSCGMESDIHMHTCIGSHRDQDFEGWGYRHRCVTRIRSSRAIFRARARSQSPR